VSPRARPAPARPGRPHHPAPPRATNPPSRVGVQVPATKLPRIDFDARLERLRAAEELVAGSGFLVTDPTNVRYLTGFAGSAGMVLVLAEEAVLLTDGRYAGRAAEELAANGAGVSLQVGRWPDVPAFLGSRADRLLLEAGHVTLEVHGRLTDALPGATLVPRSGVLERLRLVKDPAEVARLALA